MTLATADTSAPAAGATAPSGQTAQPGQQPADLAQPQTDATGEAGDQPQGAEGQAENLTDEQKAIVKLQRRIERLTAKRGGTERENELLRQQIAELTARQQSAASREGEGTEGQGEQPAAPKGRQLTEADIERMAQARAQELHRQTTIGQRVSTVLAAGSKLDGFDAAVNALAEVVPFRDRQGRPTAFIEAVLDTDNPAAVMKHLGDNPEDAEDLAELTPSQLGRRLARLEDKLKAGATRQISAAPKPLKPVGGGASGAQVDPSKMSFAEFKAWRQKEIDAKGKR
jgi:hypothetical protein